jgi:hypothetical protein
MPPFVRRFRRRAAVLVLIGAAVLVALVAVGIVFLSRDDYAVGFTCLGIAVALTVGAGAVAAAALPRSRALRQVTAANPDGAVFLAKRQPYEVSDLATFVGQAQDILDQVADRWVVASVDDRGISAWSIEPTSRELLLMPWDAIGYIEQVPLEGDPRHGVAVDVRPFPTPLLAAVGYSAYGILAPFSRTGLVEVIDTANALRPSPLP